MADNIVVPFQVHPVGRSDFDFTGKPNTIYTVGVDFVLREVDYQTKTCLCANDLADSAFAVAAFPNDKSKIVVGTESGEVGIITDLKAENPVPIMAFDTPVYRLSISPDGQFVGGCCGDSSISVYSVEGKKMYRPKPAHEQNCLHVGFNHDSQYIASTGCEGFINIYSVAAMLEQPLRCRIISEQISEETKFESLQILRFDWHPSENILAIPGRSSLQLLKENGGGAWQFSTFPEISHDSDISAVCWNSEGSRLLSFCMNKTLKLWNFDNLTLLIYVEMDKHLYNCKYSPQDKMFGFLTQDGYFGVWKDQTQDEQQEDYQPTLLVDDDEEPIEAPKEHAKPKKSNKALKEMVEESEDDMDEIDRMLNKDKKGKKELLMEDDEDEDFAKAEAEDVPATLDGEKIQTEDKPEEVLEKKKSAFEEVAQEVMAAKPSQDEQEERPVYDSRRRQKKHADIIDVAMQPLLYSSSTSMTKNKKFLCWNLVGNIVQSDEGTFTAIDIDFANKNFHSNIRMTDFYGISMACINEKGVVLASRADELKEDEYEDELREENRKFSHIIFKPLNYLVEREIEIVHRLPEGENVDAVAIGNSWFAALTDINFIRFFDFKGQETKLLCVERPLVCCAGYENYLAIVYHDSPPFLGCQVLKLKVINVENLETVYDESLPISPNSVLTWFGFSDNGMVVTQDTRGIMRGLAGFKQWLPLYLADETKKTARFWLIGVHDYNFIGVIPEKDEYEPSVYQRPPIKTLKIKFPYILIETEEMKKQNEITRKEIVLDQERFRNEAWMKYKITREKNDNLFGYSEEILDKTGLLKAELAIEKELVEMFQDCVVGGEYEKALILASRLKKVKSLSICEHLCNTHNAGALLTRITDMLEMRKRLDAVEEAQKSRTAVKGSEIVIIKGGESNKIIENRTPKLKKGLSSFAMQRGDNTRGNVINALESPEPERNGDMVDFLEEAADEHDRQVNNISSIKEDKPVADENPFTPAKNQMITKKLAFDDESGNKLQKKASLFDQFSSNNTSQNLKRKPGQSLFRDDLKKSK